MIKKQFTLIIAVFMSCFVFSQKDSDKNKIIQELSEKACACTDSITLLNRDKKDILKDVHGCIDQYTGALQISSLLSGAEELSKTAPEVNGKKQVSLNFDTNKNSKQYTESYHDIERYMMGNCPSLKKIAAVSETKTDRLSKNPEALEYYVKAIEFSKAENWKEAIKNSEMAVKKDPKFVYAWDNLGINYRRIAEYDKSIDAYKKSLEIDPNGKMPLQNIPMAYIYKKDFQKAIDAYLALDKVYPGDPEVYYGIGQVYFSGIKDDEKALDYICKSYKIYNQQKSPYRTDAEAVINSIYKNMKAAGKTEKFKEILKKNMIQWDN